ncbi:MAG TPA: FGGY family carbohydrate kinase [Acidimicrobiales bacterium]|nr:FGGY family carbohydrate kinase [Acidimicrobiales bacterium]
MILTIDLGTSVTKVVVWSDEGPVAVGRSPLVSNYTVDNRAEQDPTSWWPSVVAACDAARSSLDGGSDTPGHRARVFGDIGAIGFAAARQTFVPVAADATPLGRALLWSDRRAGDEAVSLAASFDGGAGADRDGGAGSGGAGAVRRRTGVVLDGGSVAAKIAWLERHEPERIKGARWLLTPRDLVAWRLTGEVATDHTMASASGLFEMSRSSGTGHDNAGDEEKLGPVVPGLADGVGDRLPESRPSNTVIGGLLGAPAGELGLTAGIPVVIGAGDRACEVLGTGASERWPMVSWGTTANVSVPVGRLGAPRTFPTDEAKTDETDKAISEATGEAMLVTRGALGGWLLEGGLSAAGSLVEWLAGLAGLDVGVVVDRARSSLPGSGGVIVLPWFGGARAPWWRDTARGAVVGLSFDHDVGDMARAVIESVAWDVNRCLESAFETASGLTGPDGIVLAGGGANRAPWTEILSSVTGLPTRRRRSGEAASAGAAMIVARAVGGQQFDLDRLDPVEAETSPDPSMVALYASLRPTVDAAAAAVIELGR